MPLFVMIANDHPDSLERRMELRPDHLVHLGKMKDAGRIVWAGPMLSDDEKPIGSVIVFQADDLASARADAAQDPYVLGGLFAEYVVQPVKQVIPDAG